jgi:hypothetical protein
MWKTCPRILSKMKHITLLGIDFPGDVRLLVVGLVLMMVFLPSSLAMTVTLGAWGGLALLKRGKPAGWLPHQLHALGLWSMAGVMPPQRERWSPW